MTSGNMVRRSTRLAILATGLLSTLLPSPAPGLSAPEESQPRVHGEPIAIPNSRFTPSDRGSTAIESWSFEQRERELAFLTDEQRQKAQAFFAIPEDGQGVLLRTTSDFARADLLSTSIKLDPFRWIDVTVEYAVETGDPALFVCLRPTDDPSLVDLEFLPKTEPGKRNSAIVRLHSGLHGGDYSISISVVGNGVGRILSVEAANAGEYVRPTKPVFVVDLLHRQPTKELGWKDAERLVKVFGFPSIEFAHCTQVTREILESADPALIILSPVGKDGPTPQNTDMDRLNESVRTAVRHGAPVVGICAGHQVLAWLNPTARGGEGREWGPTRIEIIKDDPLFGGMPRAPVLVLSESHNAIVEDGFRGRAETIASTDICKTQIFRYRGRPWYSFQAHIERGWEDSCPEAYLLWKNMLRDWKLVE